MAKRPPGHLKLVKKKAKVDLTPINHSILRRKRVSNSKLPKYIEALLAAYAPVLLPEVLDALRKNIADSGDTRSAEIILKGFKILKDGGINVNQNNNNTAQVEAVIGAKNFDSFMRNRAVEKRMVVDITPAVQAAQDLAGAIEDADEEG